MVSRPLLTIKVAGVEQLTAAVDDLLQALTPAERERFKLKLKHEASNEEIEDLSS